MCLFGKQKTKKTKDGADRLLITVTVIGSFGHIRFLVNKYDPVASVIDTTLRAYSRQGRLPVLGSDRNDFLLCCAHKEYEALSHAEMIGSNGGRNFMLCKKEPRQQLTMMKEIMAEKGTTVLPGKDASGSSWKFWFTKKLSGKITPH